MQLPQTFSKLFFVGMMFVLAACGGASESTTVALEPATLRWITWEANGEVEGLMIDGFQTEYPQIEFTRQQIGAELQSYLAESPPPDLINIDISHDLELAIRNGQLTDLSELWQELDLAATMPTSLQGLGSSEGKQYLLPLAFGWEVIYYNKAIFDQYNLTPPTTWDEFMLICETLIINGETPLAIGSNDPFTIFPWFEYLNLRLNGADFHRDLLAGRVPLTDDRVRAVLETWWMLFNNGYFGEEATRQSMYAGLAVAGALVRGDNDLISRNKAAMALLHTQTIGELPATLQSELDFFRFPIIDPQLPVAEVVTLIGVVAPNQTSNLPAALQFLRHVGSADVQGMLAQNVGMQAIQYAPVRTDVLGEQVNEPQQRILTMLEESDETVVALFSGLPRQLLFGPLTYEFSRFVREPDDIIHFMETFEEERQQMIDQGVWPIE